MTEDEIVTEIYNRQGFLVIGTIEPSGIGEILTDVRGRGAERVQIPLRVVAVSTIQEYYGQQKVVSQVLHERYRHVDDENFKWFYRVEAAD